MKTYTIIFILFSLFLLQPMNIANATSNIPNKIAIVIDDLGNNMTGTAKMIALPIPLTVAIMPFLSTSKQDAQLAYKNGKEVIIHLPMEPLKGKKSWLGPNPITTDLSDQEIRRRVQEAIKDIPHAVGMNNHMGSKATSDARVMRIVLTVCKENNLFFLDSKTSYKSVVPRIATELGVPYLENNLFFDDIPSYEHVSKQVQLLMKQLHAKKEMIIIGHVGRPGEVTSSVIKQSIPILQKEASLTLLSKLIK